jgi:hypothetical protein
LTMIRATVTTGVSRVGLSSRSGNIQILGSGGRTIAVASIALQ